MKYENVLFDFVSADEDASSGRGSVITDDKRMTLDIVTDDGVSYVISGKAVRTYFSGRSIDGSVTVEWGDIGGNFVGIWVEDGLEYFIRFRLPSKNARR